MYVHHLHVASSCMRWIISCARHSSKTCTRRENGDVMERKRRSGAGVQGWGRRKTPHSQCTRLCCRARLWPQMKRRQRRVPIRTVADAAGAPAGVERPSRFSTQCVLMRIGHEFDGESTRVLHSPRTEAEAIGEPKPIQLLLLLGTRIRDAAEEHDVDGALAL